MGGTCFFFHTRATSGMKKGGSDAGLFSTTRRTLRPYERKDRLPKRAALLIRVSSTRRTHVRPVAISAHGRGPPPTPPARVVHRRQASCPAHLARRLRGKPGKVKRSSAVSAPCWGKGPWPYAMAMAMCLVVFRLVFGVFRLWRHASATDRRACAEHWTRSEATLEMMMMMCLAVFGLCLAVFGL